jgi:glutamate-ammonia-ligase adenylyltransferase
VATQLASFVEYQSAEAEIWEHMALTRARVIAGDAWLAAKTERAIRAILTRPRDDSLREDVYKMRSLIASVKGDADFWDLKLAAGGLLDIEFLAQYLLLRHAHEAPDLIGVSTFATLEAGGRLGLLGAEEASVLLSAHRLMTNVTQMLRLTLDPGADPRQASEGVQRRLIRAAELPSMSALEAALVEARGRVRGVFEELLAPI